MKKKGFTLAEVLITLLVIGIVAALTVPSILNNIEGKEYRTALKKGVSALSQALTLHKVENGAGASTAEDDLNYLGNDVFLKHMSMTGLEVDAFPGDTGCYGPTAITTDGIMYCVDASNWLVDTNGTDTNSCDINNTVPCARDNTKPNVYIDVNGEKGPNKVTESGNSPKDQYGLMLYDSKVVPFGEAAQQVMYEKKSS